MGAARIIAPGLALALAALPAQAQTALTPEALMKALARTETARVAFVETRHSRLLSAPLEARGELSYRRPDRLERRVEAPFEERYVVDGDSVTIERKGAAKPVRIRLDAQPALRAFIESIRATLAGDLATLRRFYRVEVTGDLSRWRLDLLPSDPSMIDYVAAVSIAGSGNRLERMEVVEPSGDRTFTRFGEASR